MDIALRDKMNICIKCGCLLTEKNWNISNKIKHYYICRSCSTKKQALWKKHNRELTNQHEQKYYNKFQKVLDRLKINGCAICGYNECNAALEFHHVNPEDKKFSLSMACKGRSNKNLSEELNKCILLCANCHRKIHQK